jgi:hypothetical protein
VALWADLVAPRSAIRASLSDPDVAKAGLVTRQVRSRLRAAKEMVRRRAGRSERAVERQAPLRPSVAGRLPPRIARNHHQAGGSDPSLSTRVSHGPNGQVSSSVIFVAPGAGILCAGRACALRRMPVLGKWEETYYEKLPCC